MIIGNKEKIAFQINTKQESMLAEHLFFLGGKLISNENIYVSTFVFQYEKFIEKLEKSTFKNDKFLNLSEVDVYLKLLSERDSDEIQYFRHMLQIDETLDQYSIFVYQSRNITKFIWSCWDESNCNKDHIVNEVYFVGIATTALIDTLKEVLKKFN